MGEDIVTKEETFECTYSAKQQEEVEEIKKKYLAPEENKMEQLRKLDAGVAFRATMYSIMVGVIGTLLFGTGMSCVLVGGKALFVPGIVAGAAGLTVMGLAFPIFHITEKKEREKIAAQVFVLIEELSK